MAKEKTITMDRSVISEALSVLSDYGDELDYNIKEAVDEDYEKDMREKLADRDAIVARLQKAWSEAS